MGVNMFNFIPAILTRDVRVEYIFGPTIVIPANTEIKVDVEEGIGKFQGHTFDLYSFEFRLYN